MSLCRTPSLLALALLAFAVPAAAAEPKPEVVRAAKKATAAVVIGARCVATATCIDKSGLFLTSNAAIGTERPVPLKLVLRAGEKDERVVEAMLVRADAEHDLALLRTTAPGDFFTLNLVSDAELPDKQELLILGHEKVKSGAVQPGFRVLIGSLEVLSLPKLSVLTMDAATGPAHSGGPALNQVGEVAGFIPFVQPAPPGITKITTALIPARRARALLAKPEIQFSPPSVPHAQRHQPQTFSVRVTSFQTQLPGYSVQMKLGDKNAARDVEFTRQEGGVYTATSPLIAKPADEGRVPVEIAFAGGGLVRGYVENATIKAGKAGAKLSELARIERREEKWHFLGRNEQQEIGEKLGLKKVWVGAAAIDLPWNDARSITIFSPADEPDAVPYEIVVLAEGKPVASQRGQIPLVGRPPSFDTEAAGAMVALDDSVPWPASFDAPPIAAGKTGLRGLGRRYVRTPRGDFLKKDFSWDLVFTIAKDDPILFVGLGEGRSPQHEGEPAKSVNFRIHSQDVSHGEVVLTRSGPIGGQLAGKLPPGTHRAILRKQGDRVTFAIDIDNNGPTDDDIQQIVPNLREFAPFLDEANTYLFFGGGGTFQKMRLVEKR